MAMKSTSAVFLSIFTILLNDYRDKNGISDLIDTNITRGHIISCSVSINMVPVYVFTAL